MYYIYEIVGVKVGCTIDFKRRQKEQKDKGVMELLEICLTPKEACIRERELQIEKGYGPDGNSYTKQLQLIEAAKHPDVIKKRVSNINYEEVHKKGGPKRSRYYESFKKYNESTSKKVSQYTLNGEFLNTFNSIANAGKESKVPKYNISACLRGRQKTAGGYKWQYVV